MIIICDKCKRDFKMQKLRRTVLQHLVYEYYFVCKHCEHKHVSYYTDKKIRQDIKRLDKKRKQWKKSETLVESRRRLAQIKMEDKILKKEMDKLKERMM